jgi:hypothetical protein
MGAEKNSKFEIKFQRNSKNKNGIGIFLDLVKMG